MFQSNTYDILYSLSFGESASLHRTPAIPGALASSAISPWWIALCEKVICLHQQEGFSRDNANNCQKSWLCMMNTVNTVPLATQLHDATTLRKETHQATPTLPTYEDIVLVLTDCQTACLQRALNKVSGEDPWPLLRDAFAYGWLQGLHSSFAAYLEALEWILVIYKGFLVLCRGCLQVWIKPTSIWAVGQACGPNLMIQALEWNAI